MEDPQTGGSFQDGEGSAMEAVVVAEIDHDQVEVPAQLFDRDLARRGDLGARLAMQGFTDGRVSPLRPDQGDVVTLARSGLGDRDAFRGRSPNAAPAA